MPKYDLIVSGKVYGEIHNIEADSYEEVWLLQSSDFLDDFLDAVIWDSEAVRIAAQNGAIDRYELEIEECDEIADILPLEDDDAEA